MAKKKTKKTSKKTTKKTNQTPKSGKDVNKLTGTKPVPRVVTQVLGYGHKLSELDFTFGPVGSRVYYGRLNTKAQKLAEQLVKFAEQIGSTLDADVQKGIKATIKNKAKAARDANAAVKTETREARRAEIDAKKAIRGAAKIERDEAKVAKRLARIKKMQDAIAKLEAGVS